MQPEPEMHDMSNMSTSLSEHSNMNWLKDYIEPETEPESTIDESDAFLKIDLDDDHASVIIKDSKEPIDSFDDDISFEDDHEVDIECHHQKPLRSQDTQAQEELLPLILLTPLLLTQLP